ncbi:uncharacterized protein SPAPADRAFT_65206 [Spathaspora passalidarum NRRL Y-27907]|uniref:Extracellular membrane protein CFEM domain-containing protein n=1 Tax=Spathaspora passalidarum (strain NRRL Y-27907 / 11-Y1) TaxID=619300 RepID=G3AJW7_SPAPN|nr:uncharacterized protein SPAPADRAFT_65206 [Spathaspora passalidarum NRRL Y-27907]EGW34018.1 hypothetical protein SPAPADRAFT_65206 [Spathaspora passalidarum NRRL Y-27907]
MKFSTTILATLITLTSATGIHELNAIYVAKVMKRDECSICEKVGPKLEQCFPDYPNYDAVKVATCVCKFDDKFFADYIDCITNCDRFQNNLSSDIDDPKALKQAFCKVAGESSSSAAAAADDSDVAAAVDGQVNTATKNSASTIGVSFIALLGISLL